MSDLGTQVLRLREWRQQPTPVTAMNCCQESQTNLAPGFSQKGNVWAVRVRCEKCFRKRLAKKGQRLTSSSEPFTLHPTAPARLKSR